MAATAEVAALHRALTAACELEEFGVADWSLRCDVPADVLRDIAESSPAFAGTSAGWRVVDRSGVFAELRALEYASSI